MQPDDPVWVAVPALTRPPNTMAHHEPGGDTEWGRASLCFYHHEWVEMRRDVAEMFTRRCKVCAHKRLRSERILAKMVANYSQNIRVTHEPGRLVPHTGYGTGYARLGRRGTIRT